MVFLKHFFDTQYYTRDLSDPVQGSVTPAGSNRHPPRPSPAFFSYWVEGLSRIGQAAGSKLFPSFGVLLMFVVGESIFSHWG